MEWIMYIHLWLPSLNFRLIFSHKFRTIYPDINLSFRCLDCSEAIKTQPISNYTHSLLHICSFSSVVYVGERYLYSPSFSRQECWSYFSLLTRHLPPPKNAKSCSFYPPKSLWFYQFCIIPNTIISWVVFFNCFFIYFISGFWKIVEHINFNQID